jgi:ribosome-binding protein aMBF1 (putative translation factor)
MLLIGCERIVIQAGSIASMPYARPDRLFRRKCGLRVRELREAAGWSQEDFAEHCDLRRTYVGSIERGERNVAILNIRKIATALDISMSKLLECIKPHLL